MLNLKKKKPPEPQPQQNIHEGDVVNQAQPTFFKTELPEKVVDILTDEGNIDRLGDISKGDQSIILQLYTKNNIIYGNSPACLEYIGHYINLSVSIRGKLLNIMQEISRPKLTDTMEGGRI